MIFQRRLKTGRGCWHANNLRPHSQGLRSFHPRLSGCASTSSMTAENSPRLRTRSQFNAPVLNEVVTNEAEQMCFHEFRDGEAWSCRSCKFAVLRPSPLGHIASLLSLQRQCDPRSPHNHMEFAHSNSCHTFVKGPRNHSFLSKAPVASLGLMTTAMSFDRMS